MNKLKTTKYMNIFTNLGYGFGFGIIIWYIITRSNGLLPIIGVIVIFLGRAIGYGLDRIVELKSK